MKNTFTLSLLLILVTLQGCMSAADHRDAVQDKSGKLTVGTVQRQINVGMSGAEVAQVLGSPNIVTTDEQRREVWVYDKISTDSAYSNSSGGVASLILAGGADVGGGLFGNYNSNAGAKSTSQKTLTVVIKFDNSGKVRDFSYNTSSF